MALKGVKQTEEHKRKIGLANKGKYFWNGKKDSKEYKKMIERISLANNGKKHSKESIRKGAFKRTGQKRSKEERKKMSEAQKGKHNSPGTEFKIGQNVGDKSPSWRGGKSFEKYTTDWTETLRTAIRERDNYVCQICSKKQGDESLSIHHIDYNKKNCNPTNLISLCRKCHTKTNHNRIYWEQYFNK